MGRWNRRAALLPVLLALLAGACGDSPTPPVPEITELPRSLSAAEREGIQASNHFAFDLLRAAGRADASLFLSPLSACMALGMTLNGAEARTYAQMRAALGLTALSREQINASYRDLIALLRDLDSTVELGIGNHALPHQRHLLQGDLDLLRMEYERLLNDDLKVLGMTDAFARDRADFTRRYRLAQEVQLHVSKVTQKNFVEMNEEGTQAAAVTSVEVGITSYCTDFQMRVDRPFLFAIRERLSRTILFLGKIAAPPKT